MEPFVWTPLFQPSLIWTAAVGLFALASLAAWRTRATWPLWANLCSLAMRGIALSCALILAFRPVSVQTKVHRRPAVLLTLMDDSQSLDIRDHAPKNPGPSRAESGKPALTRFLQGVKKRAWKILAFDAGDTLSERRPEDVTFKARSGTSPLGDDLHQAWQQSLEDTGQIPSAVVFFSDGCENKGRPLQSAASELSERGVPLFGVLLGEKQNAPPDAILKDLTVRREGNPSNDSSEPLQVGETLLVEARAWINAEGYYRTTMQGSLADTTARLQILPPSNQYQDDAKYTGTAKEIPQPSYVQAASLRHRITQTPGWTRIRLRFRPRRPGTYRLRLSLDGFKEERNLINNVTYGSVTVIPPQRHVLYVTSRLGHDYRGLKALFSTWKGPRVEMVSDFLKPQGGSPATNRWPIEHVLGRALSESVSSSSRPGTLIWEEPDPTHLTSHTQALLRASIETGDLGIIWVVNEPAGRLKRKLQDSPLEDTFLFHALTSPPFVSSAPEQADQEWRPVLPTATLLTKEHPATRWAYQEFPHESAPWQGFGSSTVWGYFDKPRPTTRVLLAAGDRPLLSVGKVGSGRVALLVSGESWRWLRPQPNAPLRRHAPALAAGLWRHLCDWTAGSGAYRGPPVRLYLAKDEWSLGEALSTRVTVQEPGVRSKIQVEVSLRPADASKGSEPIAARAWKSFGKSGAQWTAPGATDRNAPPESGAERVFSDSVGRLNQTGEWILSVRAKSPRGKVLGYDSARIAVTGSSLEQRSTQPRKDTLQAAISAAAPGGQLFEASEMEMDRMLKSLEPFMKTRSIRKETRRPAVNQGALLFLLLICLVVDAWLRRG